MALRKKNPRRRTLSHRSSRNDRLRRLRRHQLARRRRAFGTAAAREPSSDVSRRPSGQLPAALPDRVRVDGCRRAPETGPRILFFSGGSALRKLSRSLKHYTYNSVHLVTPFDSGGSSAELRRAFDMLSVGDLRNRLMALADETVRGNPEIYELFAHRFPLDADTASLAAQLDALIDGTHEMVAAVPSPMRRIIRTHLREFAERMPSDFDLRGASIGNLVLAGGYLSNDNDIESVVFMFSKLVEARGIVRPVVSVDMQLAGTLEDGASIVGQHLLTGKAAAPIASPVADLFIVNDQSEVIRPPLHHGTAKLITGADLICFPMGSFYSSVIANLLPEGVGRSVCEARCPKVYVPNTGTDPEQVGMTIGKCVETLLRYLRRDAGDDVKTEAMLDFVLVDTARGSYPSPLDLERVTALGIEVIDTELVTERSAPALDPERLSRVLVSLA